MYNQYNYGRNNRDHEISTHRTSGSLTSSIPRTRSYPPNQGIKSNRKLPVQDLPYLKGDAMGNSLKNVGENPSSRRKHSPSNSVSHPGKLDVNNLEYREDSLEPKFAGKSSNNVEFRRNSSDSGYNSSGKFYETPTDSSASDRLQRVDLNDNKLCGKSDYSQLNKTKSGDITLPPCKPELRKTPSYARSNIKTSLEFDNPKPRSYVNDRLNLPKSPMSESKGLVGLQNLGNTCFMNSILQCLSHCWPLRDNILSCDPRQCTNKQSKMKGKLYVAFAKLIQVMWSKDRTSVSVSPHSFKMEIQRFSPRFVGYDQQDSQEFLRFLLEGLNEDLNQPVCTGRRSSTSRVSPDLNKLIGKELADHMWKQYKTRDNSLVTDIFCGQIMSTLTCTKCSNQSVTYDPFWDLSLSIPVIPRRSCSYSSSSRYSGNVTLSDCLSLFTQEEDLDGDEKPKCERCKMRQKCKKQIKIHRFPKILVIHLKRFSGFGFRSKLQTDVDFPLSHLDMSKFASVYSESDKDSSGIKYNLFAVSNHIGSAFGGHYTAYCKHPQSKEWHSFNDSRVAALSSSSVRGSQAYVLFYEKDER